MMTKSVLQRKVYVNGLKKKKRKERNLYHDQTCGSTVILKRKPEPLGGSAGNC